MPSNRSTAIACIGVTTTVNLVVLTHHAPCLAHTKKARSLALAQDRAYETLSTVDPELDSSLGFSQAVHRKTDQTRPKQQQGAGFGDWNLCWLTNQFQTTFAALTYILHPNIGEAV